MIKARWQGFNVESGENQAPMLVTHWYVLQQGLVFALFSIPFLAGLGMWLARKLLKPSDWPLEPEEADQAPNEDEPLAQA